MPPKNQTGRILASTSASGEEPNIGSHTGSAYRVSGIEWYFRKTGMKSNACIERHKAEFVMIDGFLNTMTFASQPSWKHVFHKTIKNLADPYYKHLFEIIPHGTPCKPYLDIDGPALPPEMTSVHDITRRIQELVRHIFQNDYKLDPLFYLPDKAFIWTHSANQTKVSLHLTIHTAHAPGVPLVLFRSNHQSDEQGAKHLAKRIAELDDEGGVGPMVDQLVYTKDRLMRIMCSSKPSKPGSVLLPLYHPLDYETFKKSVISWVPLNQKNTFVNVPKEVPLAVRSARRKKGGLGSCILDARADDANADKTRITELVQAKAHPSARPITPRVCVKAAEELVLRLISVSHASAYNDWMVVGWVLKRARMPLDLWLRFSQRCPEKYDRRVCISAWNAMKADEDERDASELCTFGTVRHWAKTENEQAYQKWNAEYAHALYLLPLTCAMKRVVHFLYDDAQETCVYGIKHDVPRDPDDESRLVTCYVDDNDDVYAACSHPECRSKNRVLHKRLGALRDDDDPEIAKSSEEAVHVELRFLQAPDQLPSLESGYLRQTHITDYMRNGQAADADDVPAPAPALTLDQCAFGRQLAAWIRNEFKALCIRSPMGTGKSYMLKRLINEHFQIKTVLFVTYRQTLAYEQERKLKDAGFVNYLSVPREAPLHDRETYPRVICQYDSLKKLTEHVTAVPQFDLVILDEVESLLRHSVASTISAPASYLRRFDGIIKMSERVLAMDAFLGPLTTAFLRQLNVTTRTIVNMYRPPPRTFRFTNNDEYWTSAIIRDLRDGKRVVVACMSTERIHRLLARLQSELPELFAKDAVLVHDSMQSDAMKKLLVDVDKLWITKQLVIYSPTIESGCDFSTPDHFHRMYVYICRQSCLPLGLMQMTGRVRTLEDSVIECMVAPTIRLGSNCRTGNSERTTAKDTATWLRWADTQYFTRNGVGVELTTSDDMERYADGSMYFAHRQDSVLLCTAYALADRHNARTCFIAVFQDLLESAGHRMELSSSIISSKQAYKYARETATASQKAEQLVELYVPEEPHVLKEARERILQNDATEEDKWLDFKASYMEAWGVEDVDEDFVKEHGNDINGNVRTLMLLRVLFPALRKQHVTDDEVSTADKIDELKIKCIQELMTVLGLEHPFDASSCGDYFMAEGDDFKQTRLFNEVSAFHDYERILPLFREGTKHFPPQLWTRQYVTHVVDSVLKSMGMAISGKDRRTKRQGVTTRHYVYELDKQHMAEMRELLLLRLRKNEDWLSGALRAAHPEVQSLLKAARIEKYARLLVRRPPPPPPPSDNEEDMPY